MKFSRKIIAPVIPCGQQPPKMITWAWIARSTANQVPQTGLSPAQHKMLGRTTRKERKQVFTRVSARGAMAVYRDENIPPSSPLVENSLSYKKLIFHHLFVWKMFHTGQERSHSLRGKISTFLKEIFSYKRWNVRWKLEYGMKAGRWDESLEVRWKLECGMKAGRWDESWEVRWKLEGGTSRPQRWDPKVGYFCLR